ncbi:epoxyqueuosine reductase QueH [candidate division KSB1 bacterium]|nr:epoxyqueuosine reductase QueH [candidate division KSB1 bacterium]
MKKKVLLHVCCAPCLTIAVDRLQEYQIGCWFYNPNIHPESEYQKRADELLLFAARLDIPVIPAPYDPKEWNNRIAGHEKDPEGGERCKICFEMRLEKTAAAAVEHDYQVFGTVLSTSPHKNAQLINDIGRKLADKYHIEYLDANFKKQDGYKRSIELSKEFQLYRQDYCGCIYSKSERELWKRKKQSIS